MKTRPLLLLAVCAAALPCGQTRLPAAEVALQIPSTETIHQSNPLIYSHFLEHIFHSVNGGLWGEMVWNRSFEEPEPAPKNKTEPSWNPEEHPARYWEKIGGGTARLSPEKPLNGTRSLELTASGAETVVRQSSLAVLGKDGQTRSYALLAARKNDKCQGSVWVRGSAPKGVIVRLHDGDHILAEQLLPAPSDIWQEFPLELNPQADCARAQISIILPAAENHLWLDQFSLMADSARASGDFRPDLLAALQALKPQLLRWPGGDFVFDYNWKTSVGPQHLRQGKSGWGDLDPCALGVDEFVRLCELLQASPIIVVDVKKDHPEQLQRNLDFLEYCNGPATSQWGRERAKNGHPAPYGIRYWEIGNEMWRVKPEEYLALYQETEAAFHKIDPALVLIGSGSGQLGTHRETGLLDTAMIQQGKIPLDYLSVHHYEDPDLFATGPAKAAEFWNKLGAQIEQSPNPKLRLFMSEWNAQTTDWRGGLYAGGLLNEMEKNPYLAIASPALLIRHASATSWDNAFINIDATRWFPGANYVVTRLWHDHYTQRQLKVLGGQDPLNILATLSDDAKFLHIKIVNPGADSMSLKVQLPPALAKATPAFRLIAPAALTAQNTLENPSAIHEEDAPVKNEAGTLKFNLPPYSLGVITATLRAEHGGN